MSDNGAPRRPPRSKKSPGGEKITKEEEERLLKNFLDRQEQRALSGSILTGSLSEEGVGGLELINLLRSNPELAARVRDFTKAEQEQFRSLPGLERVGDRQARLLQAFPELYQQFIAATGRSIIYDADGNPVRVSPPDDIGGIREGDEIVVPPLIGADGSTLPTPPVEDTGVVGSAAADALLAARANREAAQSAYGDFFDADDLFGGEG